MRVGTLTSSIVFHIFEYLGCGGTISCHNGICFDCGIDRLKEHALKKSGLYRWDEQPESSQ